MRALERHPELVSALGHLIILATLAVAAYLGA